MNKKHDTKLGLLSLTALTVGAMIGGGIFALPQNLSAQSSAGGILVGWIVTGIGIVSLALVFRYLLQVKPHLKDGIYSYPEAGFGKYVAFNSAWGYWLSAWIGNVSYAVLLFSALGYFFPIFGDGNTPIAILCASIVLWIFHLLLLRGVKEAMIINSIVTIAKLIPIALFIILVSLAFQIKQFTFDFWGMHLGSVFNQVKSTMLVTVWVFIGVEGAMVESSRARNHQDVARATLIGIVLTLFLYVLISLLSFGILPQSVLAEAKNPSMAFVLEKVIGHWGMVITNVGLIISLIGAWLGWTLLTAQLPYDAALNQAMPKIFAKENDHDSPAATLWLSNGLIQVFLVIVLFSHSTYLTLLKLSTSCILVPYLLCSLYALQVSLKEEKSFHFFVLLSAIYGVWLLYAAGMQFLLLSGILYAFGILFYAAARLEQKEPIFVRYEWLLAAIILASAVISIIYFK